MIWFFLCGMIAGAVGTVIVAHWWFHRHVRTVSLEEMIRECEEGEDQGKDLSGD